MLNVGAISEGFVLDHIQAGKSMKIYDYLKLNELDCPVAMIMNARSSKMGRKDILKIECDINLINLDVIGYLDPNITVNIIKGEKIVEKRDLSLPAEVKDIIRCRNPRCITSIEHGLEHVFFLADPKKGTYRCKYCEEEYGEK